MNLTDGRRWRNAVRSHRLSALTGLGLIHGQRTRHIPRIPQRLDTDSQSSCIDKTSSAELTETINSMYTFYQHAMYCFVFLDDVLGTESTNRRGSTRYEVDLEAFSKSRWFTRGWTLQELLAPSFVIFYDKNRNLIASRSTHHVMISAAAGIPLDYVKGDKDIWEATIAQRMSWASKRQTTRVEDRAYSLLGLFDVNMPLLYGEGTKAFLRLQLEIIRQLDDQSIFAWGIDRSCTSPFGILAQSPDDFSGSGNVISARSSISNLLEPTQVTNRGIAYSYTTNPIRLLQKGFNFSGGTPFEKIQLPCATSLPPGHHANIMLQIAGIPGMGYSRYRRVGVVQERRSGPFRIFDDLAIYERRAYIAFSEAQAETNSSPPEIAGNTADKLSSRAARLGIELYRVVIILALLLFCWLHDSPWHGRKGMLMFGILILARDLAKSYPTIFFIQDFIVIGLGAIPLSNNWQLKTM